MKIIDISWPISGDMTAYKNRNMVDILPTKEFERDQVRESKITLGSHSGTHVDAPAHFLCDGLTIDQLSLDQLIGSCVVLDSQLVNESISAAHCKEYEISHGDIVIFKTINSLHGENALFDPSFIYLDQSAASYLVEKKVKAVGFDYLGIERNQPAHETHTIFMQARISIIEGLRLAHVKPGRYFFVCLPLYIKGGDAAPARAVLFEGL